MELFFHAHRMSPYGEAIGFPASVTDERALALRHRDVDAADLALGLDLHDLLGAVGTQVEGGGEAGASTNTSICAAAGGALQIAEMLRLFSLQLPEMRSPWLVTSLTRSNL